MDALPKTTPSLNPGATPGNVPATKTRATAGNDEHSAAASDSHSADAFMAALLAQGSLAVVPAPATLPAQTAVSTGTEGQTGQVLPLTRPVLAALLPAALRPAAGDLTSGDDMTDVRGEALATASTGSATLAAVVDDLTSAALPATGLRGVATDTGASAPSALDFVRDGAGALELVAPASASATSDGALVQGAARATPTVSEHSAYAARHAPLPIAQSDLFAERLNQQISVMLSQHNQQARIACAPPELGPVDIRITLVGDEASVQLAAPHGATREALEEALPRLRAALADSGLALGQAGVFADLPQRQQHTTTVVGDTMPTLAIDNEIEIPEAPVHVTRLGLVDAFV